MSESEDNQEKIIIPGFETKYNELPNELLQKAAYCKWCMTQMQAKL